LGDLGLDGRMKTDFHDTVSNLVYWFWLRLQSSSDTWWGS